MDAKQCEATAEHERKEQHGGPPVKGNISQQNGSNGCKQNGSKRKQTKRNKTKRKQKETNKTEANETEADKTEANKTSQAAAKI